MEIHTNKLTKPIITLNFKERSLLFAELAQIAYLEKKNATKIAKQLGLFSYAKDANNQWNTQRDGL